MKKTGQYITIGTKLKSIRRHLKLTAIAMAREMKISKTCIYNFENGTVLPSSKYLIHLFDKYHVNMNYIIGKSNVMINEPDSNLHYYNFGKQEEEVKSLIHHMAKYPLCLLHILGSFIIYQAENSDRLTDNYAR